MSHFTDRIIFSSLVAKLVDKINSTDGYCCTLDDGNVRGKVGHCKNSFHYIGLAQDVNLFRFINGKWQYQDKSSDHKQFGEWWEAQHPRCTWGGRFNDGNHYSFGEGKK